MATHTHFFKKNPLMLGLFIAVIVFIVVLVLIAVFSSHSHSQTVVDHKATILRDKASSDTPVETLKTLTAEISSVEQQNQKLIEQNKALVEQDKKALAQFKTDILSQVQQQIHSFKTENQALIEDAKKTIGQGSLPSGSISNSNSIAADNNELFWVDDLQSNANTNVLNLKETKTNSHLSLNSDNANNKSLLLDSSDVQQNSSHEQKKKAIPYYTIPVNATLTGAIALQPIIGRIPIESKIPDPYTFKVVIGAKNLAANEVDIPSDIQGIVASGIAEGDMLGSCARGQITSMTFVFFDGRISTTEAKQGDYLGSIAAANGNPCIKGSFHSNAAIYLGAQAALAGIQGYGNALSQSQLSNTTSNTTGTIVSQLVGSANTYAAGQGFSAAAQSSARWWDQRVQNSFDFVFVPNVDSKTGKKLQLNINITQEIAIDYDFAKRKVFYSHDQSPFNTTDLD